MQSVPLRHEQQSLELLSLDLSLRLTRTDSHTQP